MNTVKLNISRDKAFVGAIMPYCIIINGEKQEKLKLGKSVSYDLPNNQSTLSVSIPGSSFGFHKAEKEVVLFPQYCKNGIINCHITSKLNWLGIISFGIVQSHYNINIHIDYV